MITSRGKYCWQISPWTLWVYLLHTSSLAQQRTGTKLGNMVGVSCLPRDICFKNFLRGKKHLKICGSKVKLTIFPHSNFHTLLESAILAVIPVLNIYWTILVSSTRVREIPSNASLEKTFTAFASKNTVMLPRGFISANNTFDGRFWCSRAFFGLWKISGWIKRTFKKNRWIGFRVWKFYARALRLWQACEGVYVHVYVRCRFIVERVHNKLELKVKQVANWRGWWLC